MRGKPAEVEETATGVRIIPAHAGQTALRRHPCTREPDHPRACGANHSFRVSSASASGSSPRMRGKHRQGRREAFQGRIIPAHAGQTRLVWFHPGVFADHPRACGANRMRDQGTGPAYGSSPRMRGKPERRRQRHAGRRIIPAHAGQTRASVHVVVFGADHPRACGANRLLDEGARASDGSSPRMRGKLLLCHLVGLRIRIIPAHAGQTVFRQVGVSCLVMYFFRV